MPLLHYLQIKYLDDPNTGCHLPIVTNFLLSQGANFLISGNAPGRLGNYHPNITPYQSFEAKDGHFIIAVGNDSQFAKLCQVVLFLTEILFQYAKMCDTQ